MTEDGTESFIFSITTSPLRAEGSGDFAPRSGYGGAAPIPAARARASGPRAEHTSATMLPQRRCVRLRLAAGALDVVRIPAFKGADTSRDPRPDGRHDERACARIQNNEAYGAMQAGVAWGWSGTITNLRVCIRRVTG